MRNQNKLRREPAASRAAASARNPKPHCLMFKRDEADTINSQGFLPVGDHDCASDDVPVPRAWGEKERWLMRAATIALIVAMLMLGVSPMMGAASDSADTRKTDSTKGITVEDLWRGLKSAEQNIEREIPKIGPAIADTWKKITRKASKKSSSQGTEKQKK